MTADTWQEAYDRETRLIETHPRFNDLVKAVAAAECCPSMPSLRWLQRNSRTYGLWATRQADGRGGEGLDHVEKLRARRLCKLITDELFPREDRVLPDGEYEAKVRGRAQLYARARRFCRQAAS